MMTERLRWRGQGQKLLFLPGWNTPSKFLEQAIPLWFLERWRCALLEWPGMGRCETELPSKAIEGMLAEISSALEEGPFAGIVGFCLGGVTAWESARRTQMRHPMLVMVESPYHFPAVLAPVLIPGLGTWIFRSFSRNPIAQAFVTRILFHKGMTVPQGFWESFSRTPSVTTQAYLRILKRYERLLPAKLDQPRCPCHRILGRRASRILSFPWGRIHAIQAQDHVMEGVGHFPASEDPEAFFQLLDGILRGDR